MIVDMATSEMVIGVDLSVDELLVIADILDIGTMFPIVVGIQPDNVFDDELREIVWGACRQQLTDKGILAPEGTVHPGVAALLEPVTRPQRTLEGRWWRKQDQQMVRFAICRREDAHVIIRRTDDHIVLQACAASVGLAAMIEAVIGNLAPANMGPVTGPEEHTAAAEVAADFTQYGADAKSAATLIKANEKVVEWVRLDMTETLPGGKVERPQIGAGILDSELGRIVSIPKTVSGQIHTTFMSGTRENMARMLRELASFLPSTTWQQANT